MNRASSKHQKYLALIESYLGKTPDVVQWIGEGEANEIVRVGDLVFRFPKTDDSRRELSFEFQLYQRLSLPTFIKTPRPIHLNSDGTFAVYEYIKGRSLEEPQIRRLSAENKKHLAESLARFINEFSDNEARAVQQMRADAGLKPRCGLVDPWIQSVASKTKEQDRRNIFPDFEERYSHYCAQFPDGLVDQATVVLHDDLHNGNILFNEQDRAVAVIDFADAAVSNIYNELRCISGMGRDVLADVISKLEPKLGTIFVEDVVDFAVVYEMCIVLERKLILKQSPDERFAEAEQFLAYVAPQHA